jgi:hypothetical protein
LVILFQGAAATFPSFYCDVKLGDLKSSGHSVQEHNFNTSKCKMRSFESIKSHLQDQVNDLNEDFDSIESFAEAVSRDERHDLERIFREKGKNHNSVIGRVQTGVESFEYVLGGPLHNEIGLGKPSKP